MLALAVLLGSFRGKRGLCISSYPADIPRELHVRKWLASKAKRSVRAAQLPPCPAPPVGTDYVQADTYSMRVPGFVFALREGKLGYHKDLRGVSAEAR